MLRVNHAAESRAVFGIIVMMPLTESWRGHFMPSRAVGEPAIDLLELQNQYPKMQEATLKQHPINTAIQYALKRATGKRPHSKTEEVN